MRTTHLNPTVVYATDRYKAVVLMLFIFVWLSTSLLRGRFTFVSDLMHIVCVVYFSTEITSLVEGIVDDLSIVMFSLLLGAIVRLQFEPRHNKTNKMSVRPAKTQVDLSLCWAHIYFVGFFISRLIYDRGSSCASH